MQISNPIDKVFIAYNVNNIPVIKKETREYSLLISRIFLFSLSEMNGRTYIEYST